MPSRARQERWSNPLMGWTSTADPVSNLSVSFSNPEQAIRFCKKRGWKYEVRTPRYGWREVHPHFVMSQTNYAQFDASRRGKKKGLNSPRDKNARHLPYVVVREEEGPAV